MKKILIVSHALELGGAEKALLGLLETIDITKYQVDLFLMRHQGELIKYIPAGIRLLYENSACSSLAIPLARTIKNRQFRMCWGRIKGKLKARKRIRSLNLGKNDVQLEYSHKYTVKYMPEINGCYDLAISFLTPHYYVAGKVKAKKKIAWIHTDYSKVQVDYDSQIEMWEPYDYIASISDQAAEEFKKTFPPLANKVFTMENIMPMEYLDKLVNEFSVEDEMHDDGSVKLLSVGRFCTAKNFDNVPEICSMLISKGIKARWYLIGFGADEGLIRNKINEFNMQENVIVLGKKANPYPYFKACDIYIQPSRFEGKCVSVREAQILGKSVVITDYPTSKSQLDDGVDGIIVPMENEKCANGIAQLINDKQRQRELIKNTKHRDYSNKNEINKLYELIED